VDHLAQLSCLGRGDPGFGLAARIIAKDPWTPVVAAAIIGFLPRFVFLSAFVTNDNLPSPGTTVTPEAVPNDRRPTNAQCDLSQPAKRIQRLAPQILGI